jgi:aspartokinase/homoserine dehydrogenase 1
VAVVRVQGAAMVNEPGVAGRILGALGEARVNVDALAASMTSLSCTIGAGEAAAARHALRHLQERGAAGVEDVSVRDGAALLGVVGDRVAADPSLAGRLLARLAQLGIDVHLVCHGPGDVGLSCAIPEPDLRRALLALHEEFFPATRPRAARRARSA